MYANHVSGVEPQLQHQQTITIRKYVGASSTGGSSAGGGGGIGVGGDTESTLSNVTSIHSQLQSFNEQCDDAQQFYNSSKINHQQQQLHQQQLHQPGGSDKIIRPQVLRAMNKHSVLLQELHQRQQTQAATSRSTTLATAAATATNLQHLVATGCTAPLTITTNTVTANIGAVGAGAATVSAAAAAVVSPNKVTANATATGKTATILVSKSKTKTGLPLLLKNSINN
ncbi:uncharacterized protein LOC118736389 [Rhagoletis pomonella]|uniref:uncharacterized protein LOC118736389 n=1 Tax=Rhagoletis pomonella TaxID=28610 RepID=UPI0017838D0D|nr:uncharacterized protein LOC118736389 [Rhagoletis pomonella]